MKRQFFYIGLHQLHQNRTAWLPFELRERAGAEGGREQEESVYSSAKLQLPQGFRLLVSGEMCLQADGLGSWRKV